MICSGFIAKQHNVGIATINHPPNRHFYGWYKPSKMVGLWHCYTHIIHDLIFRSFARSQAVSKLKQDISVSKAPKECRICSSIDLN